MKIEGEGQLLRVFIGESDRWEGQPLYEAIVRRARADGLPWTTLQQVTEAVSLFLDPLLRAGEIVSWGPDDWRWK